MANPNVRRPCKRCANPACGKYFRPKQRYSVSRFCSRPCSAATRPRAFYVQLGRISGEIKRRMRKKPELIWNIRQQEYRRGFGDGYEQALQDMKRARVA